MNISRMPHAGMHDSSSGMRSSPSVVRVSVLVCKFLAIWLPATVTCLRAQIPGDGLERTIRSGCEIDYPPFCIVHEDGRADGFSVELMRAALERMGCRVTFRTGPWAEVRGWLERGEIDALPLVGRTPEREQLFDFTVPYLTMHGAIVVRRETTGIHSLADLRGQRVAVMRGDNAEEFLLRKDYGVEIVSTPTFTDALEALSDGQCDAVVIQRLVALRLLAESTPRNLRIVERPIMEFSQDFCFAVREGDRDTLALLNEGLALVVADGTHRRLHAKWFAHLQLPADRPIVVGGDHHYPPFEFVDDRGRPNGFTVELTRAVAREMNLEIRFQLGPWADIPRALNDGEIDVIQGMFYTSERDRTLGFSPSYLASHYVSVVRVDQDTPPERLEALAGRRVAAQAGDAIFDVLAAREIEARIVALENQEEVLRAVLEGRADCGLVVRLSALHAIETHDWKELRLGERTLYTGEYCYAVAHGNEALLAQFSEGLRVLQHKGEYRRIHEKWLGVYEPGIPVRRMLQYIALVAVPLLLVAALALLWSWTLRGRVAERTAELRSSTELQRAMVACSPVALYSIDLEGTVLTWNEASERIFGWTAAEVIGGPLPIVPEDARDEFAALRRVVIEGHSFTGRELLRLRKDGSSFPISLSVAPILDAQGRMVGIMAAAEDITERRKQEEALHRIEWMLSPRHAVTSGKTRSAYGDLTALNTERTIMDAVGQAALEDIVRDCLDLLDTSAAVYERNGDYALGLFTSGWCRLLDEASRRLCGTEDNAEALACGRWHCHESCWTDASKRAIERGEPVDIECRGGLRLYAVPIRAGGQVVGAIDFGYGDPPRDTAVLERIAAAYDVPMDELKRQAERYESRPPYIVDMAKRRLAAAARLIGEMVQRSQAQASVRHLNRVLRAIRDVNQLIVRETDPQSLIRGACNLLVEDRGYNAALIVLTDAQGRATGYAHAGMDAAFSPLAAWLDDGRVPPCCAHAARAPGVYMVSESDSACRDCPIATHCPGAGVMCAPLVHADEVFGYLAVSGAQRLGADDEERDLFVEVAGDLGYALHGMAAHSAREEAEKARDAARDQLLQSQKMESVGRLAGGVAHDFNNLLMGIMNYVELCRDGIDENHPIREWLDEIGADAQRSATLIRQLLAFARKQTIAPRILDLNDALGGMLRLLRRLIGEDIDLLWKPCLDVWSVKVDPGQLDQILVNLCVNARDAIGGAGKVTIETANVIIDRKYCAEHDEARPGDYAQLAVSDDGHGMDRETRERVFEPFFTTKPAGKGTGLGLSTVYGIVRQNHGFVNVYSEPQRGTTFRICLPRFEGATGEPTEATSRPRPMGGTETILLVEDEKAVRMTTALFLEQRGYTVLTAQSPEEAERIAERFVGAIQLLITDVVMPGMSGRDLAERLAEIYRDMKVLYISGYTANVIAHRGILEADVDFLPKPFTRNDIAEKVRKILDG